LWIPDSFVIFTKCAELSLDSPFRAGLSLDSPFHAGLSLDSSFHAGLSLNSLHTGFWLHLGGFWPTSDYLSTVASDLLFSKEFSRYEIVTELIFILCSICLLRCGAVYHTLNISDSVALKLCMIQRITHIQSVVKQRKRDLVD
jgi:hypothetical protein